MFLGDTVLVYPSENLTTLYCLCSNELPCMEEIKQNLITVISPNVLQVCLPTALEGFTEFSPHILNEDHFLPGTVFNLNGSLPLEVT